jgi:hypothetical protein
LRNAPLTEATLIPLGIAEPFEISEAKNLFERALSTDDLDLAIGPIQKALSITKGDTASFFAELGNEGWRTLSRDHRRTWLAEWLRQEIWSAEV